MDLLDIRRFVAIATTGSLSAAARQAGTSAMSISRSLEKLEAEIGARLFHRTTRALSLTPEGEQFLPFAAELLSTQDAALASFGGLSGGLRGTLRITAPNSIGRTIVVPVLAEIMTNSPMLRIDFTLSDRALDVVAGGFDLAIRVAPHLPSDLAATKLADGPRVLCASPGYLARHGTPRTVPELAQHSCLTLHDLQHWQFSRDGRPCDVKVSGPVVGNSIDGLLSACLSNMGISYMTCWNVADALSAGGLVSIALEDARPSDLAMWAIFPSRRQLSPRITHVIEALRRRLMGNDQ